MKLLIRHIRDIKYIFYMPFKLKNIIKYICHNNKIQLVVFILKVEDGGSIGRKRRLILEIVIDIASNFRLFNKLKS